MKKPKNSSTIGVNVTEQERKDIEKRAKSMNLSLSKYFSLVMQDHIGSGRKLVLKEQ